MSEPMVDGGVEPEGDEAPKQAGRVVAGLKRFGRTLIVALGVWAILVVLALTLMEVLMAANSWVLGDDIGYALRSDFDAEPLGSSLSLPGSPIPVEAEPDLTDTTAWRGWLVRRHAPVVMHLLGEHPEWDIPVSMTFDGNDDPRDNLSNVTRDQPGHATVYGELTAITADSWYLTYTLYHLRDYDHPVREALFRNTHHDGDNEGMHIRIDRSTGEVTHAETWFHNRFLLCARTNESSGTDPVLGRLNFEGTHPIFYVQWRGHGVRCAQRADEGDLARMKVLRPALGRALSRPLRNRTAEHDLTYEIEGFERWHARAAIELDENSSLMFVEQLTLNQPALDDGAGVAPIRVGHYIAALDREGLIHHARPKPMWSWDDAWDAIPVSVWYFLPSYSFATRSGLDLSHDYEMNLPVQAIFGMTGNGFADSINWDVSWAPPVASAAHNSLARIDKWSPIAEEAAGVDRRQYWKAARIITLNAVHGVRRLISRYVTRVFTRLG